MLERTHEEASLPGLTFLCCSASLHLKRSMGDILYETCAISFTCAIETGPRDRTLIYSAACALALLMFAGGYMCFMKL